MWKSLDSQSIHTLKTLSNVDPTGLISASTNFSEGRMEEKGELDHYIGVATTKTCPEQFKQLEVPASTWAIFEAIGLYLKQLGHFLMHCKIYGDVFIPSGFHLRIMNKWKDRKSYGMKIKM